MKNTTKSGFPGDDHTANGVFESPFCGCSSFVGDDEHTCGKELTMGKMGNKVQLENSDAVMPFLADNNFAGNPSFPGDDEINYVFGQKSQEQIERGKSVFSYFDPIELIKTSVKNYKPAPMVTNLTVPVSEVKPQIDKAVQDIEEREARKAANKQKFKNTLSSALGLGLNAATGLLNRNQYNTPGINPNVYNPNQYSPYKNPNRQIPTVGIIAGVIVLIIAIAYFTMRK